MDLIQRAIDVHGAKAVYDAAAKRLDGDAAPLVSVGLTAPDLAVAWAIMSQAHRQMNAEDQAREHWSVQQTLT